MERLAALALAALLAACATFAPERRPEIVAYYAGWKAPIAFEPRRVTVVVYAFLYVAPDGAVAMDDPSRDAANLEHLRAVRERHPHLRLMAAVGGWTRSDGFSDMAASAATRATFIASSIAFLRRHRYDGIDIDWEFPGAIGVPCAAGRTCDRPEDMRNFALLLREMRAAFDSAGAQDKRRYLLTIAADARKATGMAALAPSLDWINLMTYDYHGNWEKAAGLHAALHRDPDDPQDANADASVRMYLAEGIPAGKLTLGIPFYSKGWTGCAPGPRGDGLYQPCREALPEFPATPAGSQHHWNAAASVPYSYDRATGTFITYDDERSVRAKARYAKERRLLGAMFWELSADRDGRLGEALARELGR
jgi:chitinase